MAWYPTPKSRRCYQRAMSGLERGGQLRFLTLTSSPSSPSDIQRSWRRLVMRLRRRNLMTGYLKVPELTKAGAKHLHVVFRGSFIDQALISHYWSVIHNAPVVDIRLVRYGRDKHHMASYIAKYMVKERAGRYSWDWGWVWRGFVKDWTRLKKAFSLCQDRNPALARRLLIKWWRNWLHDRWKPPWRGLELYLGLSPGELYPLSIAEVM